MKFFFDYVVVVSCFISHKITRITKTKFNKRCFSCASGIDKIVKQSGVDMLGYPLMRGLSKSNQEKNLQHYKSVIPASSPSTAWSMLAINLLDSGKEESAHEAFEKSFTSYVKEPFKVSGFNDLS